MEVIDHTGQRFGRLLVLSEAGRNKFGKAMWLCRCDCGTEKIIGGYCLRRGQQSCGCLARFVNQALNVSHGDTAYGRRAPEHRAWEGMKSRCYNEGDYHYPEWGGRGIRDCDRWLNGDGEKTGYECFLSDMGRKPTRAHSLDRYPDNDGNYEPGNCRWATPSEQQRNRRSTIFISVDGTVVPIAEAAERYGVPILRVWNRLKRGWPDHEALFAPPRPGKSYA